MKVRCVDCPREVEFRDRPDWKPPRRFRCFACKRARAKARRAARTRRRRSSRDGLAYPTNELKVRTGKTCCEICGLVYTSKSSVVGGVVVPPVRESRHHLIPRRLAVKHGEPDHQDNILSVDAKCHGQCKAVDNLILRGDWVGAVLAARVIHLPLERLQAAAARYGFDISGIVENVRC